MGWDKKLSRAAKRRLEAKGLTPSSRLETKVSWEVRYRGGRKLGESRGAYARRTGDKKPSDLW